MAEREDVIDPVPFPAAFRETDAVAAQTQAAVLLLLGAYLEYERELSPEIFLPREAPLDNDLLPEEDRAKLGIPRRLADLGYSRGVRLNVDFVRESLPAEVAELAEVDVIREPSSAVVREILPALAERLARDPSPLVAAQLCEVALSHPDELVRVAGASSYAEILLREQQERLLGVLVRGVESDDPLVAEVAAIALARLAPGHLRLADLVRPSIPAPGGEPSRMALLVHGTFARRADWWQPGFPRNFHQYLKAAVDPSLYSAPDRFEWSGFYSDHARDLAALELVGWVQRHGLDGLDFFTHSHGGSVAMQANRVGGIHIGRLVLLSCPVHWKRYFADLSRVRKAVSIRVHLDLVILADRGGQRFPAGSIPEIVLPIWFKHSITHEPPTWIKHKLPSRI